ncbi:hypothetical protein GCM10023322_51800 [Rugosimonospora acidiphila]|uniref:DUF1996 domain-containing protein n=1 Tax=Rugosimonospora acidiphila TaxID=556531 RepID=A0ABP9S7C2_9ACTN
MLVLEVLLLAVAAVVGLHGRVQVVSPAAADAALLGPDFVDIGSVPDGPPAPVPVAGAATGTYTWDCGRNEEGHRNTANVVVVPGVPGPIHHVHDYVGNTSTDVNSTIDSLAAGGTTCTNGDKSTYYWPVLRLIPDDHTQHEVAAPLPSGGAVTGGANGDQVDPHADEIQVPASVRLTYYGNPRTPVVAMPYLLRGTVGDATAITDGGADAVATWTCSDTPRKRTTKYPICAPGTQVLRVFDFPSCWDGRQLDSTDHRAQLVFPTAGGGCPVDTFAVPRLQIVLAYNLPSRVRYRIDAFDGQNFSPLTDHAFFVNLMPDQVMTRIVRCLNTGEACDARQARS